MQSKQITRITTADGAPAPKVGFVSLGCPKALVDSERILTKLRSDGYALSVVEPRSLSLTLSMRL